MNNITLLKGLTSLRDAAQALINQVTSDGAAVIEGKCLVRHYTSGPRLTTYHAPIDHCSKIKQPPGSELIMVAKAVEARLSVCPAAACQAWFAKHPA